MQNKSLTPDEFRKTYQPGQRITFYKKSPFGHIGSPKDLLFVGVHWNELANIDGMVAQSTTGTMYACRVGFPDCALKFYLYSLRGTAILDIKKKEIGYHYTDRLEPFLEKQAKEQGQYWVIDSVSEAVKKLSQSDPK